MPRKRLKQVADEVADHTLSVDEPEETPSRLCMPTGSTLLNLAVSNRARNGGWGAGKVVNLVGDSNTGKTLLALTGLMEMVDDPQFDDHRLIYDDAEAALEMPVDQMFGPKLASRLEDPHGTLWGGELWRCSDTIDEVKNRVWMLLEQGIPFVYILDSYDSLTSKEEIARQKKDAEIQKKIDKLADKMHASIDADEIAKLQKQLNDIKEQNRDYPRGPAVLSELLRKAKAKLKFTDSLLMVISQTRDVIDAVAFAATKRRAGGNALRFYSSHEVWLAVAKEGKIKKTVKNVDYTVGYNIVARSVRSKLTGVQDRRVPLVTYTDYGVDDLTASCAWLLQCEVWKGSKMKLDTRGFIPGDPRPLAAVVRAIEERRLEPELADLVERTWGVIQDKLALDRRRRWE
jgi:RecA/RadA recombinase